eukprot:358001-Chlamydomonas_euryale.AAC.1
MELAHKGYACRVQTCSAVVAPPAHVCSHSLVYRNRTDLKDVPTLLCTAIALTSRTCPLSCVPQSHKYALPLAPSATALHTSIALSHWHPLPQLCTPQLHSPTGNLCHSSAHLNCTLPPATSVEVCRAGIATEALNTSTTAQLHRLPTTAPQHRSTARHLRHAPAKPHTTTPLSTPLRAPRSCALLRLRSGHSSPASFPAWMTEHAPVPQTELHVASRIQRRGLGWRGGRPSGGEARALTVVWPLRPLVNKQQQLARYQQHVNPRPQIKQH